jgi:glycosyltransferase involved in cell wall biosynthesis/tetratricopeptide (TPR) repeat protein
LELNKFYYDVVILGDVLEHIEVNKAKKLIVDLYSIAKEIIVAVPFEYIQEEIEGNPYQVHLQPDLTRRKMFQRYPRLKEFFIQKENGQDRYGYYIKDNNYNLRKYKIASYSICKNEINYIDNFINKLHAADYICILDTGSTDGTWEKLQEYAKKDSRIIVKQKFFLNFRFDEARNDALKLVPDDVDICIVTDIDEEWQEDWRLIIEKDWSPEHLIWDISWKDINNYGEGRKRNMHKNIRSIKWYFSVHEVLGFDGETPSRLDVYNSEITLIHLGKPNIKKSNLYFDLLKIRVEEDKHKKDAWSMILLGLEYITRQKNQEALNCFRESLTYEEDYNSLSSSNSKDGAKANIALLLKDLGIESKNKNENEKSFNYLKEALDLFSEERNVFYNQFKHNIDEVMENLKEVEVLLGRNKMKPTLHMIGLFHTICHPDYDHCAFTGKVWRFSKMMRMQGYNVIEYSNGDSLSEANEHVQMLTKDELMYHTKTSDTVNTVNHTIGTPHWKIFNERILKELKKKVKPGDIICHPFGPAHPDVVAAFPNNPHVETGIGYPNGPFGAFRIFESYAVMHYHQGMHPNRNADGSQMFNWDGTPNNGRHGNDYEWVIPNYYDLKDWEPNYEPGKYLLFFGRVVGVKGMDIVEAIANELNEPIRVVGNGELERYKNSKNLIVEGPITGAKNKSDLLRNAKAIIVPSRFVEPFAGVHAEAMLCGTPVISSDFGVFSETIENGKNGFRCQTLGDYLDAIKNIDKIDRKYVAEKARARFSLEEVGKKYDVVFKQLSDLSGKGWYTPYSHKMKLYFPTESDFDDIIYED